MRLEIEMAVSHSKNPALAVRTARLRSLLQRGIRSPLAWEIVWSFALKALSTGLGFFATVPLARLLGAEGYGIYAYALSLVTIMALPAHAGLPNLVLRETAKGLAQGRPDLVKGAWQWAGRVVAALSLLAIGVGGPLFIIWQGGLKSPAGQTMAWALLLVPLIALGNLRGAALRGLQRIVLGQLPEFALRPGIFLLFVGGAALLRGRALSPPLAMMFQAVASLLAFIAGAWLLWRHMPDAVRYARPAVEARGWLMSSAIFALLASFGIVNSEASTIVLGLFATPDAVGRYRVAVQVATLAAFGLQAVNMVVAPRFADLWARGEKARLQRLVTRSAQVVLIFNILMTAGFILAGRPFFHFIFGPEFDGSYGPLLVLLVGQMVNSAAGSVGFLLNMTGYERDTAKGMGIAAALNIVLSVTLVPVCGIIGAAMAAAISMVTWNGLLWWRVRRRLGINSTAFSLPRNLLGDFRMIYQKVAIISIHLLYRIRGKRVIHFLHIGKTGGTALREALRSSYTEKYKLIFHGHSVRFSDIPRGDGVVFFVRDPISRFVSGFLSRKRQGMPRYRVPWSPGEARAFAQFATPNELARALSSADDQLRQAAIEAMQAIRHVNTHYRDWLGSEEYLWSRLSDIFFVGQQETLESDFEVLKKLLGITDEGCVLPADPVRAHKNVYDSESRALEPEARENLMAWYAEDYRLLEFLLRIREQLNKE